MSTVQETARMNDIKLGKQEGRKKKKKNTKDKDLVKTAKGQAEKREPAKRQKEQSDKAGRTAGLLLNVLTNYFLQLLCFT